MSKNKRRTENEKRNGNNIFRCLNSFLKLSFAFFEEVIKAVRKDPKDGKPMILWGICVLFLVILIITLVLANLTPLMQQSIIVLILLLIVVLFFYTFRGKEYFEPKPIKHIEGVSAILERTEPEPKKPIEIKAILEDCKVKDDYLLKYCRSILEGTVIGDLAHDLRTKIFAQLDPKKSVSQINSLKFSEIKSQIGHPGLVIEFDNAINRCYLRYNNQEKVYDNQDSFYECSCNVPEEYKNKDYSCRIHPDSKVNEIDDIFGRKYTCTKYQDVQNIWFKYDSLWPPSLDSIFMAKILKEQGYGENKTIETILDIGCGTGFIGTFLAKKILTLKKFISLIYFLRLY